MYRFMFERMSYWSDGGGRDENKSSTIISVLAETEVKARFEASRISSAPVAYHVWSFKLLTVEPV